jgi:hypothetical protein
MSNSLSQGTVVWVVGWIKLRHLHGNGLQSKLLLKTGR